MAKAQVITTDTEIEAALERAKHYVPGPYAVRIDHLPDQHLLIIHLSNGHRLPIPLEHLPELANATPAQLANYELLGPGTGIHFPDLDADFYVPYLLEDWYLPFKRAEAARHGAAA